MNQNLEELVGNPAKSETIPAVQIVAKPTITIEFDPDKGCVNTKIDNMKGIDLALGMLRMAEEQVKILKMQMMQAEEAAQKHLARQFGRHGGIIPQR